MEDMLKMLILLPP